MRFEWDDVKDRRNLRKHKISFENAKRVFDDPHALADPDREVDDEVRWQTVGVIGDSITIVVAYTYREEDGEEVIRIISARKASPLERRAYGEGNWPLGQGDRKSKANEG
jgi:uncharacterized DUF497 family protein